MAIAWIIPSGEIGLPAFRFLLRDTRLSSIPLILETPTFEETGVWRREIELLYEIQCLEGSEEEVEVKLGEVKAAWTRERDEIKKNSKKGDKGPKPPKKKGKKGKADADADEEDEDEG
jgi:AP endonuclease 1